MVQAGKFATWEHFFNNWAQFIIIQIQLKIDVVLRTCLSCVFGVSGNSFTVFGNSFFFTILT